MGATEHTKKNNWGPTEDTPSQSLAAYRHLAEPLPFFHTAKPRSPLCVLITPAPHFFALHTIAHSSPAHTHLACAVASSLLYAQTHNKMRLRLTLGLLACLAACAAAQSSGSSSAATSNDTNSNTFPCADGCGTGLPVTTTPLAGGGTVTTIGNAGGSGGATIVSAGDGGVGVVGGGGGQGVTVVSGSNGNGGLFVSNNGNGASAASSSSSGGAPFNPFQAVFGSMAAANAAGFGR